MGLEVTRILARAKGSFQSRKVKKSTLGMSSRRSQYRTLQEETRWLTGKVGTQFSESPPTALPQWGQEPYLEEPISSYSSSRHWWGSLILDAVGGGHAVLPLAPCRLAIPPAVAL